MGLGGLFIMVNQRLSAVLRLLNEGSLLCLKQVMLRLRGLGIGVRQASAQVCQRVQKPRLTGFEGGKGKGERIDLLPGAVQVLFPAGQQGVQRLAPFVLRLGLLQRCLFLILLHI